MRIHPLVAMVTLVIVAILALMWVDESNTERYIDPPTLTLIVLTYFAAALVMLWRTGWAYWTVLGAGLLATMTGDAMFYAYLRYGRDLPQPDLWLDVIRALFLVGGPFVLIGLAQQWRAPSVTVTKARQE